MALLLAGFWAAAFFFGGYYYSRYEFNQLMAGFEQTSKRYNLPYEGLSWAARLSALLRRTEVSDKAIEEIKHYLHEKEEQIKDLEEHLYFYRKVAFSEDEKKGLAIFSVNLQRDMSPRTHSIEVILRNYPGKKTNVKGIVRVLVEGQTGPRGTVLSRDDLLEDEINFSFRHFQRLSGVLRLPGSFSPLRLSVIVDSDQFEDVVETYAWAALLKQE